MNKSPSRSAAGHAARRIGALLAAGVVTLTSAASDAAAEPAASPDATAVPDLRSAPVVRGNRVYAHYCVTCHGANADGNGRAAALHNPRPADLRSSDKNEAYVRLILQFGGQAMGRSAAMPPWSEELSASQIDDLIAYLRTLNGKP